MGEGKRRRYRSQQERRAIVEESFRSGVSVAQVARAHDINANQLFAWRKLYREGHLGGPGESRALIPVQVRDEAEKQGSLQQSKPTGVIEIDLGHARVRIEGLVDPACVRAAVAGLLR